MGHMTFQKPFFVRQQTHTHIHIHDQKGGREERETGGKMVERGALKRREKRRGA